VAKILVADDNSNIQKMVGLALKDQGIDVVAVGNGEAAVRKISDIHPDLVLADVFMPVRNGYEVCRYVKEDPALSHTPVILLVGAFDPLDEQEAQRVGADGVLKKPFVPPDPLIAMVKSALTRAGVAFGAAAAAEKAPAAPSPRSTADILNAGVSSKLAALAPEKLPEVAPEPMEEFPTATPQFKIAAGSEPLAFGSLLDTSDADDMAVTAKPMIDLSAKKWEEGSDEIEEEKPEEEEEEKPHSTWRPGGLDEVPEVPAAPSHASSDWRDQAFHGDSPANSFGSNHWPHALEQPAHTEAAESESVAVATVLPKPAEATTPFTSDAWAAAMANGIEEKIAELRHVEPEKPPAEVTPEVHAEPAEQASNAAPVQDFASTETASVVEPATPEPVTEPVNWAAVPETPWEVEARKAALLASTWDAPKSLGPEDTQDIPAYSPEAHVEPAEAAAEAPAEISHYSAEPIEQPSVEDSEAQAEVSEPVVDQSAESTTEPKSYENAWEAPAIAPVEPAEPLPQEPVIEAAQVAEQPASPELAMAQPPQVNMDELVDKVLGKMNPEVLQKVTHEILRPLIEAIVRAEIESKKP
jgi:CheY-like chemotaxis protein